MPMSFGSPLLVWRTSSRGRSSGLLLANLLANRPSETTKPAGQGSDLRVCGGQGRGRTADLPIFSRTLVPTELPGLAEAECDRQKSATPTGLEPATSAVTGRRANQLRYGALDKAFSSYPQRDSNPCYRRERAGSWAARRWGPGSAHPDPSPLASSSSDPSRTREAYGRGCSISKAAAARGWVGPREQSVQPPGVHDSLLGDADPFRAGASVDLEVQLPRRVRVTVDREEAPGVQRQDH